MNWPNGSLDCSILHNWLLFFKWWCPCIDEPKILDKIFSIYYYEIITFVYVWSECFIYIIWVIMSYRQSANKNSGHYKTTTTLALSFYDIEDIRAVRLYTIWPDIWLWLYNLASDKIVIIKQYTGSITRWCSTASQ